MTCKKEVSRRKFLQTAAGAGVMASMAAVAIPLTASAEAERTQAASRPEHPLETILSRYGSELGHLKRAR